MGSRSRGSNKSTSTNAAQMAALQKANPAPTMGQAMGSQQAMQGGQLGQMMSAFNAMKQAGDAQMGENPLEEMVRQMLGGHMPQQPQQPMFDMSQFEQQQPQVSPRGPYGGASDAEIEHLRRAMARRNGFGGIK